jgi:hypothetical protein
MSGERADGQPLAAIGAFDRHQTLQTAEQRRFDL